MQSLFFHFGAIAMRVRPLATVLMPVGISRPAGMPVAALLQRLVDGELAGAPRLIEQMSVAAVEALNQARG